MSNDPDPVILQLYVRTPAPCRDYCSLTVTSDKVTINVWNIAHGLHVYPKSYKCPLNDVSKNQHFDSEVNRIFGRHVFEFVKKLSRNELNLMHVPTKFFLAVIKYLATKDVMSLSQLSKTIFEVVYKYSVRFLKIRPEKAVKSSTNYMKYSVYRKSTISSTPNNMVKNTMNSKVDTLKFLQIKNNLKLTTINPKLVNLKLSR